MSVDDGDNNCCVIAKAKVEIVIWKAYLLMDKHVLNKFTIHFQINFYIDYLYWYCIYRNSNLNC